MLFSNPVRGVIHPSNWTRPSGNVDFRVTQRFGCTGVTAEPPFGSCAHFHRGIDLGNGKCGADVFAAHAGKVYRSRTFNDGSRGVIIDHGSGIFSIYGHLATLTLAEGVAVAKGQKIGTVGSTGNSTACHLHFAIKTGAVKTLSIFSDTNGKWNDPWPLLEQNVTIKLNGSGVFVRNAADLSESSRFAESKDDGKIHRLSDNADLGATSDSRKWGGSVIGASYTVGGSTSNRWERVWIGGAYRFVASLLTTKSAS